MTVVVAGFPQVSQFVALHLDIETLVVDNTQNSTAGVAWSEADGQDPQANYSDPALALPTPFSVLDTAGAQLVTILGGTQSDSLTDQTTSAAAVTGTIDGSRVELRSGSQILTPSSSATFQYVSNAMTFDGLTTGAPSYTENGFTLTPKTSGGSGSTLVNSDTTNIGAAALNGSDKFTLTAQDGGGFSLYALSLASTSGTQTVTLTGTTLNGKTVTKTLTVTGGFTQYTLAATDGFVDLASVSWTRRRHRRRQHPGGRDLCERDGGGRGRGADDLHGRSVPDPQVQHQRQRRLERSRDRQRPERRALRERCDGHADLEHQSQHDRRHQPDQRERHGADHLYRRSDYPDQFGDHRSRQPGPVAARHRRRHGGLQRPVQRQRQRQHVRCRRRGRGRQRRRGQSRRRRGGRLRRGRRRRRRACRRRR
ncbi:MAG: hypothetical protein WDO24_04735 [Pseudomonadota bacterium]